MQVTTRQFYLRQFHSLTFKRCYFRLNLFVFRQLTLFLRLFKSLEIANILELETLFIYEYIRTQAFNNLLVN